MNLTKHQRKILKLLRSGYSYRQVADQLGIAKGSVGANLTHLKKRLDYASITDLRKALAFVDLDRESNPKRKVAGVRPTPSGTWRADIQRSATIGYKHIGTYRTKPQAMAARLEAEKEYSGVPTQSGD